MKDNNITVTFNFEGLRDRYKRIQQNREHYTSDIMYTVIQNFIEHIRQGYIFTQNAKENSLQRAAKTINELAKEELNNYLEKEVTADGHTFKR